MAKKKKAPSKKLPIEVILLLVGLVLVVGFLGYRTNWFNMAAGPSDRALANLNSTTDMLTALNPDGTMGPKTSNGNWSNSLPSFLTGKLVFEVIDPPGGNKPDNPGSQGRRPTESYHMPQGHDSDSSMSGQRGDHGPQNVTALNLTVSKVEVHLAYTGKPGDNDDNAAGTTLSVTPADSGKAVDHWETLAMTSPVTLDLVELAKTHDASSLGITNLAEGRYTEVRLYVSSASATLENGTAVDLEIPGKNNIVRVVRSFTITAGQTTTLTMDIDAQRSVIKAGNKYMLKPVVARLMQNKH